MRTRDNTESRSTDGEPGGVFKNLMWLAFLVFATAEVAMVLPAVIYVTAGHLGVGAFLVASAIYTLLIGSVVLISYRYTRRLWRRGIAEQTRMAEQVRESQQRLSALFESSADGIFYTATDGRIVECNEAFASMLGYSRDELEGFTCRDLTPAEWRQVDDDIVESQLKNSGYSDEYMKEYVTKDGKRVPVTMRSWFFYDGAGRQAGTWGMVRDLSERIQYENFVRETIVRLEQANDRLQELDRLRTELVAMVSHELRAPLGVIESSLNAMRALELTGSPVEQGELIKLLDRGVQRLSNLVGELMDITRIESGQLKLELKPVDAVELTERVVNGFKGLAAGRGIELVLDRPESRCNLRCDPHRIEQVLTNLLDNALKFTDHGGVSVRVRCSPSDAIFSVTDSGPGLPTELHHKVFEKFFSLDLPTGDGKQGIGLGLAISRGIVEAHGGRIWVESGTGAGVTFSFEIPRVPRP